MGNLASKTNYHDERRYEMLDGILYEMAMPTAVHIEAAVNIESIFKAYLYNKKCKVYRDSQVIFSNTDKPVPDISVVCDKDRIKDDGIHGAPDLVVEVMSPNTGTKDKGYKKRLYERYGVKEYWLVDTTSRYVDVYLLDGGRLEFDKQYTIYPDFIIEEMLERNEEVIYAFRPSIFPDMKIEIEDVFEGLA
jgi:Uma2 family endonuclease